MKDISITAAFLIILTLLGFYLFKEAPKINRLQEQSFAMRQKYDSLLNAKQKITVRYDTIRDTIYIPKLYPYKTTDTIYLDTLYKANYYKGSVGDSSVTINYKALTFGTLENIELSYRYDKKTTTIENILYVDKPFNVEVWTPKRHLYIIASAGMHSREIPQDPSQLLSTPYTSQSFTYGFDAVYMTRKQIALKVGYLRIGKEKIYSAGVGVKVF
jgi:hypothetical protein